MEGIFFGDLSSLPVAHSLGAKRKEVLADHVVVFLLKAWSRIYTPLPSHTWYAAWVIMQDSCIFLFASVIRLSSEFSRFQGALALTECVSTSFLTPARMVQSRFLTHLTLSHVNCVLPLTNRLSYAQLRLRTSADEQACQPTVQFRQHRVCAIILFFAETCSHCCIKARGHLKDESADASDRWVSN